MSEAYTTLSDFEAVDSKSQGLSWAEKVNFCEQWKNSGLSKKCFCRNHGFVFSTFCGWCGRLWPKEQNGQLCQVAVVERSREKSDTTSMIAIEINFPNQVSASIHLNGPQIFGLIKELVYATTASR